MSLRDAFEQRNLEAFLDALDPDVFWQGIDPDAVCRNRDEVRSVFEEHLAAGRTGSPEIVAEVGDQLVIDPHPQPPVGGLEGIHHVYTLRHGKVVRMQDYADRQSALAAVGLA